MASVVDAADSNHLVVIFGDEEHVGADGKYSFNRKLWECYQAKKGVPVRFLDPRCFRNCLFSELMMLRVCAMHHLLQTFLQEGQKLAKSLGLRKVPRWVFQVDGDTIMVNQQLH
ncbi:unnamed protein product [Durusdinium trenchii]|uniref:Serine/threonine-protein phosphatase n=2 Tax=Durusdinium trenchii TaxID=1381693 RepID=A0ABP0SP57_9DINO